MISTSADPELTLRRFELLLLEELGYQIQWQRDFEERPIQRTAYYCYQPDWGFLPSGETDRSLMISGVQLLTLADWQRSGCAIDETCQAKLKGIMRLAIDQRLGGRPLKVREAVTEWRQLTE